MRSKVNTGYKVVGTPPDEEVDWLSPITASYTWCHKERQGGVLGSISRCQYRGMEPWRTMEFEQRIVYFTSHTETVLTVQQKPDAEEQMSPSFSIMRSYKTLSTVMNVFLSDPEARLLAEFMWISCSNGSTNTVNRSCILCDRSIVIPSEEATFACQHFFPLSVLAQHVTFSNPSSSFGPQITTRLKPAGIIARIFILRILPPDYVPPFRQPIVHNKTSFTSSSFPTHSHHGRKQSTKPMERSFMVPRERAFRATVMADPA